MHLLDEVGARHRVPGDRADRGPDLHRDEVGLVAVGERRVDRGDPLRTLEIGQTRPSVEAVDLDQIALGRHRRLLVLRRELHRPQLHLLGLDGLDAESLGEEALVGLLAGVLVAEDGDRAARWVVKRGDRQADGVGIHLAHDVGRIALGETLHDQQHRLGARRPEARRERRPLPLLDLGQPCRRGLAGLERIVDDHPVAVQPRRARSRAHAHHEAAVGVREEARRLLAGVEVHAVAHELAKLVRAHQRAAVAVELVRELVVVRSAHPSGGRADRRVLLRVGHPRPGRRALAADGALRRAGRHLDEQVPDISDHPRLHVLADGVEGPSGDQRHARVEDRPRRQDEGLQVAHRRPARPLDLRLARGDAHAPSTMAARSSSL